ncbi:MULTISPECIES: TonB-dependent receptor [Dyadobacter]|uniref:TonB-dependent receptor n=1 Tax=Dyadobacter chenhuakuii TaxID=2909339 RepID=A0A9X1QG76_9BACT|nr:MULTISPECIES: TonB-dependent receptor [Dyadobacter]MCF2495294.1 TonB-dependent receptor [Dyadobacter chenhuakuii]MCF2500339.1 TonB-dependent receptor [Dyadobacter chenhuakuii]MCF2516124.1 TonB-dependent receptor [Dyadobacter sp. CY351]USJ29334.1 TonB-dependent receptor [Dyadobacter chenhuakuii]
MKNTDTYQWLFRMRNIRNALFLIPALSGPFVASANMNIASGTAAHAKIDKTLKGKVTDKENGEGLPGVNVVIKGSSTGTTTDGSGNYTLQVPETGATLVFSFVGYTGQEVEVGNRTTLDLALESDSKALSEVVVIGYGTAKKSDLTGSVGSVKEDQLKERPAPSLNQALQGKVSGVQVNVNSGRPGGRANVRIRGFSSINSSNNPLYVVDGVMLPQGNQNQQSQAIDFINPNDIVSVEVLKDASSTAIYGARGANGVILVTTKKGKSGEGVITYNLDLSVPTAGPKRAKVLNAKEYLAVEDLAYANIAKYDPAGWAAGKYAPQNPKVRRAELNAKHPDIFTVDGSGNFIPNYDTDWFKEATQHKVSQNHQLGFSGGNNKTTYSLSLNYRDDQGLIKTSYLKRYSTRFSIDDQVKKWLRIGATLSYNNQAENLVDINDAVPRQMVEDFPFLPVKYPDGTYANNRDYPQAEGAFSSVHRLMGRKYNQNTQTTLGSLYSNITLAPGLEMRSVLGVNILTQEFNESQTRTLAIGESGTAGKASRKETFWSFENYLTYNKTFNGIHAINALLGISWQETNLTSTGASVRNFSTDYFGFNNLGAGATLPGVGSGAARFAFNSYFGRVNYTLKEKYLLTVTGRIDGSSKFGDNHKYAVFPSAALAWKVSDEEFLKGNTLISNLKIRTSYGLTGNSEIPSYSSLSLLSSNYATIYNDARFNGTGINRLANPDLKWEKTAQTDAGLEISFLKGRISVEADYYYRKTTDMLLDAPVPRTSGYAVIRKNIGSMENKGVELALNTTNIERANFSWNTNFNISFNRSKVLSLATPSDIFGVGGPGITNQTSIIRIGEPVGAFWGLTRLGVWSEAERDEAAKFTSYRNNLKMLPGDIKYKDFNGDGAITDADRRIIGNGSPKGWGTLANSVRYGNFDLTFDMQFSYGNDLMDMNLHASEDRVSIANSYATVLGAWTPQNQNSQIAEIRETRAGYVTNVDTRWIFDGSFLRGRNLLLGYSFPSDMVSKIKLSKLRIYVSAQNFFLLTKYPHGDPEQTPIRGGDADNVFSQGMIWHSYPKPTTYMAGLQIAF